MSQRGRVTNFDWEAPHALYRAYDPAGRLLYIGVSHDPAARLKVHRATTTWGKLVASLSEEWLPARKAALAAERVAVERERPLYNVTYTDLHKALSVAGLSADARRELRRARAQQIAEGRASGKRKDEEAS